MSKLVVLKIEEGSFEDGFPVSLENRSGGNGFSESCQLPPYADFPEIFNAWRSAYIQFKHSTRIEKINRDTPQNCSTVEVNKTAKSLEKHLNYWLNCQQFIPIRDRLVETLATLPSDDEMLLIFQTQNPLLRRLPWHIWDLLKRYSHQLEIGLSAPKFEAIVKPVLPRDKVRILAVFGDSTGIHTSRDRQAIENLASYGESVCLDQPSREELNKKLWDKRGWDILFFCGHSKSDEDGKTGRIYLKNNGESLTINELEYALRKAIERGLQIAIFNSCDGLGIAWDFAELHIPYLIVMRELVSDAGAQFFLQDFLELYSGGKSFYTSVREARQQLQGFENESPCASWLPVICQSPNHQPPTWNSLCGAKSDIISKVSLDKMPDKGQNKVDASAIAQIVKELILDEINQPNISLEEEELYQALLKLDYQAQNQLFRDLLRRQARGCFLIQGKEDCGQNLLLTRLIKQIPRNINSKIITIDLGRTSSISRESLLEEIGEQVGIEEDFSPTGVAKGIYEQLQSRNTIIIFYSIQVYPSESLPAIIDFWYCLNTLFQDNPLGDYKFLIFLLDYGGKFKLSNLSCVDRLDDNWNPETIVKSPLLPERFTEDILKKWLAEIVDILPQTIINTLESNLKPILEKSKGGVPKKIFREICKLCNCDWDNIRRRLHS